jgi:hypothetical protein
VLSESNAILEALLVKWGEWCFMHESAGLGYPSKSAFAEMRVDNDRTYMHPDVDLESMRIEELVRKLPAIHREIIRAEYNPKLATKDARYHYSGCKRNFYATYLDDAKERLIVLYNSGAK